MKWIVGGCWRPSLLFGIGFLSSAFITEKNGQRTEAASADKVATLQRFRLQMEAIAFEEAVLSLCLEVGEQPLGQQRIFRRRAGPPLGTGGQFVKVRHAFMNWTVPAPHTAGGSSILVAGIVAGILVSKLRKLGVNPKAYFKAGD